MGQLIIIDTRAFINSEGSTKAYEREFLLMEWYYGWNNFDWEAGYDKIERFLEYAIEGLSVDGHLDFDYMAGLNELSRWHDWLYAKFTPLIGIEFYDIEIHYGDVFVWAE